jgi:tetratricopeptide (TPR) repeat protein
VKVFEGMSSKEEIEQLIVALEEQVVENPRNEELVASLSSAYLELGVHLEDSGNAQIALEKYLLALDLLRDQFESSNCDESSEKYLHVANVLDHVASACLNVGDFESASEYFQDALEMRESVFGSDVDIKEAQLELASSAHNLGSAVGIAGDANREIELYLKALEWRLKASGGSEENEDVIRSFESLASAFGASGQSEREVEYASKCLALREKLFGNSAVPEKQLEIASSQYNLGFALAEAGQIANALELLQKCYNERVKFLGADHPDSVQSKQMCDCLQQ